MKKLIDNEWNEILTPQFESEEYQELREFLKQEYSSVCVYPPMQNIYEAFKLTPPENVKVVILGQDPYINENQAHGLSFSVMNNQPPPSLVNIFKELKDDLGIKREDSNLTDWAQQGVLLLNSVLTVRGGISNSHKNKGWEQITSTAVSYLAKTPKPIVFLLWGRNAQNVFESATENIELKNKLVIKSPHPSPFSASSGFFGSKPFSKTNEFLDQNKLEPINW